MTNAVPPRLRSMLARLRAGVDLLGDRGRTAYRNAMQALHRHWLRVPGTWRVVAAGTAGMLALLLLTALLARDPGCATRADAEARLAAVMGALQQEAAHGQLTLAELAKRVTQVNVAATAFARTGDAQAYCAALGTIRSGEMPPVADP